MRKFLERWRIQGLVTRFRKLRFKLEYIKEDKQGTEERKWRKLEEKTEEEEEEEEEDEDEEGKKERKYLDNSIVESKLDLRSACKDKVRGKSTMLVSA